MRLGLLYALGHAATVTALGARSSSSSFPLPHGIDRIAERLVGLTLPHSWGVRSGVRSSPGNPRRAAVFHLLAGSVRWINWKIKSYWYDHDIPPAVEIRHGITAPNPCL